MGKLVAFIDDDVLMHDIVGKLIASIGLDFEAFDRPRKFLERFDRTGADIIVSDLVMPEMTGLDLLRVARDRQFAAPIIIVTAYADVQVTASAFRLGALDFLEKPFSSGTFLTAVQRALAQTDSARQSLERQHEAGRLVAQLSRREAAVIRDLLTGASNKEIARTLGISHRTVEHHRQFGLRKLGVRSLIELAASHWRAELDSVSTEGMR